MQTKLTLRLDSALIRSAKDHARQCGKSVSQLVADYFEFLESPPAPDEAQLPPITRSLYGVLEGASVDKEDYQAYLEEKHR